MTHAAHHIPRLDALTFGPDASLGDKLDAIRALSALGSRGGLVLGMRDRIVRDYASPDAWEGFGYAYAQVLASVAFALDPGHGYGEDRIQSPDETLDRRVGDCDDHATLALSLARAFGLRGRIVTLSVDTPNGPYAVHVFAEVDSGGGVFVAADSSERLPLGVSPAPRYADASIVERWEVEPAAPALGFLGAIVGAVGGFLAADENKKAAKQIRKGQEAQASAVRDQADANREQTAAGERISVLTLQDNARARELAAVLDADRLDAAQASADQAFTFARRVAPAAITVAALAILAPVVVEVLR